jgi:hemoglobin
MRHAEFKIGTKERDAWLMCMRSAVNELEITSDQQNELWSYLEGAAQFLINSED